MTSTVNDPTTAVRTLRVRGLLGTAATGVLAAAVLAACGGGSTTTTASTSAGSGPRTVAATGQAAAPGGQNGQGGPDGDRGAEFQKVQECLTAAGISLPTPTGGANGGAPPAGGPGPMTPGADGRYTAPDGDVYTAPPTRGEGDGGGAGPDGDGDGGPGGMFSDPKVQAALKACGITLPTRGARPSASPTTS